MALHSMLGCARMCRYHPNPNLLNVATQQIVKYSLIQLEVCTQLYLVEFRLEHVG